MPDFRTFKLISLAIAVITLAACGGGGGGGGVVAAGGGGGDGGANPAPATQTLITVGNAPAIASAVFSAVFTIDDVGGLANPVAGGGSTLAAKSQSSLQAAGDETNELPCASGTSFITITDGDLVEIEAGSLSPGNTFNLRFENCDEGDGVVTNGEFNLEVLAFDGDLNTGLFLLEAALTMTNFSLTVDGETTTLNANMTMRFDLLNAPVLTNTISGGSIAESSSAGGATTMTDFIITTVIDETTPSLVQFTTTGSGALTSSEFDDEVMFNIQTAFASENADNPMVGEMLITGADGTRITLVAFGDLTALLHVDVNGDVITLTIPWSDLL